MFGILSTTLSKHEIQLGCELGYLSALRGVDSTGISIGYRKKDNKFGVYTHRMLLHPADFFREKDTHDVLDTPMFFLMGHTRAATIGDVNIANAHPHVHQHIVGTHNGTIAGLGTKDRSDSSVLFEKVATEGVAKGFGHAEDGAYATVFADVRARTLNFYRNIQRPLWMVWNKSRNTMLWASEREMLDLVINHNSMNGAYKEPFLLAQHQLLSIPFGTTKPLLNNIEPIKPPLSYPLPKKSHARRWDKNLQKFVDVSEEPCDAPAWVRSMGWDLSMRETVEDALTVDDIDPNEDNASPFKEEPKGNPATEFAALLHTFEKGRRYDKEFYQATKKLIIPTEEAELVLKCGCTGCGKPMELDDTATWFTPETVLCDSCDNSEFAKIYAVPAKAL